DLQAESYAADLEANGVRFFADAKARDAAERVLQQRKQDGHGHGHGQVAQAVVISPAEESVREVVFEQAVRGQHEKMAFPTGPAAVSRTWHLRAETWRRSDVDKFERKLTALLGGASGARGGGQTARRARA
ncbi:hypothetical protein E4U41_005365, partial [Claviceps citrina]